MSNDCATTAPLCFYVLFQISTLCSTGFIHNSLHTCVQNLRTCIPNKKKITSGYRYCVADIRLSPVRCRRPDKIKINNQRYLNRTNIVKKSVLNLHNDETLSSPATIHRHLLRHHCSGLLSCPENENPVPGNCHHQHQNNQSFQRNVPTTTGHGCQCPEIFTAEDRGLS